MTLGRVAIDTVFLDNNMVTGKSGPRVVSAGTFIASDATGSTSRVRLAVRISTDPTFASSSYYYAPWRDPDYECDQPNIDSGHNAGCVNTRVTLPSLSANTRYYVRVYINYQSTSGTLTYRDDRSGSFYTDRSPSPPTIIGPADGTSFDGLSDIPFEWVFNDPDSSLGPPYSQQRDYDIVYYTAATGLNPAGDEQHWSGNTSDTSTIIPISLFQANTLYEWYVLVHDNDDNGAHSGVQTFFVGSGGGVGLAVPLLITPIDEVAVAADEPTHFAWQFRDAGQEQTQRGSQIRWRTVGTTYWFSFPLVVSPDQFYDAEPGWVLPGLRHIEWQVQTYNADFDPSDWSQSGFFWLVEVGQDSGTVIPSLSENQPTLGVGHNRVYIYERGGNRRLGEITPLASVQWSRTRDAISNALIATAGIGDDEGILLRDLRTWRHEIVIFRDGVRVWEGPVVRVEWDYDHVEIEALDVMAYIYRRIMRAGYNDSYQMVRGVQLGLHTVVYRSRQIIMNALAMDDPNVLRYVTAINNTDDAKQSRIVPAYSKSAWAEVDDLAATAGLDYTTVGRRIILWDTHQPIGRLPEMSDGDFSDRLIVTEYGMQAANVFAVTNNGGVYGLTTRIHGTAATGYDIPPEGLVEQVASAYGEAVGAADTTVLTPAAKAALVATLTEQAERNIAHRWPVPVVVRVPDNTTLEPDLNLGINQLVPGVHIPLRSVGSLRTVTQVQKLDSMQVREANDSAESITVILSPAPLPGEDPDTPDDGEDP